MDGWMDGECFEMDVCRRWGARMKYESICIWSDLASVNGEKPWSLGAAESGWASEIPCVCVCGVPRAAYRTERGQRVTIGDGNTIIPRSGESRNNKRDRGGEKRRGETGDI